MTSSLPSPEAVSESPLDPFRHIAFVPHDLADRADCAVTSTEGDSSNTCTDPPPRSFRKGPVWHSIFESPSEQPLDDAIRRQIAAECYGLGSFTLQLTPETSSRHAHTSSPLHPTLLHLMLHHEPQLNWLPTLLSKLISRNVSFTAEGHARMIKQAKKSYPLFLDLPTLYALQRVHNSSIDVAVIDTYEGIPLIARALQYPLKFVDTGVIDQLTIAPYTHSNDHVPVYKFLHIDMTRQELVLVRSTLHPVTLRDPTAYFLQGCREAAAVGAMVFETHMTDAHLPPPPASPDAPLPSALPSQLRGVAAEARLPAACFRLPRTRLAAAADTRGAFLCGEALPVAGEWVTEALACAGIVLDAADTAFLRAARDVAGDERTRFDVAATALSVRLSAVAELALQHDSAAKRVADKVGQTNFHLAPGAYLVPLLALRIHGALCWLDGVVSPALRPAWVLIGGYSLATGNPWLGHLLLDAGCGPEGSDAPCLLTKALRATKHEELERIAGHDVVAAAKKAFREVHALSEQTSLEPHFARQFRLRIEGGGEVFAEAFRADNLYLKGKILGQPYYIEAKARKVIMTEAGLRYFLRTLSRILPGVGAGGVSVAVKERPDKVVSMTNTVLEKCMTGEYTAAICQWVVRMIVSRDITCSLKSGSPFVKLFAIDGGEYTLDGNIPALAFQGQVVMEDGVGALYLVLSESVTVELKDKTTHFDPVQIVNTSQFTFKGQALELSLPVGNC